MLPDSFDIHRISYYEADNKIWGWFTDRNKSSSSSGRYGWGLRECYCFWAVVGKTISINKHPLVPHNMEVLQKRKLANKYQEITEPELLVLWPTFRQDLSNRYIFATLRDSI